MPAQNQYSVADLWDGLNPWGVLRGIFMVHKCYIDESYDQKTFVLSCSIGAGDKWLLFEKEWAAVLGKTNADLEAHGRKTISRYHATSCAGMSGEFEGWDVHEQKRLTAALIGALRKIPMHSVAFTVLLDDLRDAWLVRRGSSIPHSSLFEAAYYLTMQFCMFNIGNYLYSLNPLLRVTVIHDHSDYDGMMLSAFNHVKYTLKPPFANLFSTIAPMNSKECLPLQLADFLAYEFFKDRGAEEYKGRAYKRRKSLALTLQTGTGVSLRTLTRDTIGQIMDGNLS